MEEKNDENIDSGDSKESVEVKKKGLVESDQRHDKETNLERKKLLFSKRIKSKAISFLKNKYNVAFLIILFLA